MDAYLTAEISASIGSKNLGEFLSNGTVQKYAKIVQRYQQIVKTMADVSTFVIFKINLTFDVARRR